MTHPKTVLESNEGVALIGLGKMGLPMARNLVAKGFRVVGYDLSTEATQAAAALGVEITTSPADAASKSAVAMIVVGFDNEAIEVTTGESGLLAGAAPGYIVTVCSTVESDTSIHLAEVAKEKDVVVVDATLCLGEPAAEDATLLIMCGGPQEVIDRIQPSLEAVGRDIYRLGEVGAGQTGKMLNNYLLWNSVVANYESLRLGARLGLDLEPLRQALMLSSGNNWALETWLRSRPMPWAEKDMMIVMKNADAVRLPMPNAGLVREEIKAIKVVKNAWTEGGGSKSSMNEFTRAHI